MKAFALFLSLLFGFSALAQVEFSGIVKDKFTSEPLIGANVVYAPGKGAVTDLDGKFTLSLEPGDYEITVSYIGYESQNVAISLTKNTVQNFSLATQTLNEVQVVADVARERVTPVAYANVLKAQIQEELGGQDLPLILNSTPGVYATSQGGGFGDARITIRGFDQRNIAVMIDGVPVNDMENGWVYWSNWFGLSAVTRTTQVQRGLGAARLALPSVGGTMNILTEGIQQKASANVSQTVGNNGYSKTQFGVNTGKLKSGTSFTFAGAKVTGDGWVDQTWVDGYFYYVKAEQQIGNHIISASAFGAPQKHGQRPYKRGIETFDKEFAANMFQGSETEYLNLVKFNQALMSLDKDEISQDDFNRIAGETGYDTASFRQQSIALDFIDTTGAVERGRRYNEFAAELDRYTKSSYNDTIPSVDGASILNTRQNYYHKPQITLRDIWDINDKWYLATTAYASFGSGGGTGVRNIGQDPETGQVQLQPAYYENQFGSLFFGQINPRINTKYSSTETNANGFMYSSINNHSWFGALSNATYKPNDKYTYSFGLDARTYKGEHYREVYDLLGADYYIDLANRNQVSGKKTVGDKIEYYNDGLVRWLGGFGQAEYSDGVLSAFVNVSAANTWYKRIDYFKNKDLVIDGQVYDQAVGNGEVFYYANGQSVTAKADATVERVGDSTYVTNKGQETVGLHQATAYTNESAEARHAQTEWVKKPGFTIKTGVNYNLNERQNVFVNVGLLSKAPKFAQIFDFENKAVAEVKNELVKAVEAGYVYSSPKITAKINGYYTVWENKPLIGGTSVVNEDDPTERVNVNINGMNALHKGIEIDFSIPLNRMLTLEGIASFGDWKWTSADTATPADPAVPYFEIPFDAKNVKVGDAAQTQIGGMLRFEPVKGAYIKPRVTYFDNHYSNFDPFTLRDGNEGRQSWKMPGYYLIDLHLGYSKKFEKFKASLRGSVLNVMDALYISDANNNDTFVNNTTNFDANSASVFFGQGRRFTLTLQLEI